VKLVGYADRLSVSAGESISFMISSERPTFSAELVRLIHGDVRPAGPGFKSQTLAADFAGEHSGIVQLIRPGSYARIPDREEVPVSGEFTIQLWIMPTTPKNGVQTLCSKSDGKGGGFALRIEAGCLVLHIGNAELRTSRPLRASTWYSVAASVSASSGVAQLIVRQCSGIVLDEPVDVARQITIPAGRISGDLLFAAECHPSGTGPERFYNGKIDTPRLYDRAFSERELTELSVDPESVQSPSAALWDLSLDISGSKIVDVSGNQHHGILVNRPTRGVTGRNWDGTQTDWRNAQGQYAAIHFHDDDLSDAGWLPAFSWTVPDSIRSGVYAVHLTSDADTEDYIPFAVVPRRNESQAQIALVLPTFSYLAYANEQMAQNGTLAGLVEDYPRLPEDQYIVDNRLISLYDRHSDGSTVCYSSWLRPIVNMRPKYTQHWLDSGAGSPHLFPADLHLVDWLVTMGYEFDVLTDLELHQDGADRLRPYQAVLTGTHAEYCSGTMLDAYQGYLTDGGHLMYLSGNGFYWVTELDPDTGQGIEIRRRSTPVWNWPAPAGEAHSSSTGELAGIWGWRGRNAQLWLGVGFNGEGDGPGRPFKRTDGSNDPRVAFAFDGIGSDELIGDFPSLVNSWGAAGFELDYCDAQWGAPDTALVVATADDFGPQYEVSPNSMMGGPTQHPKMRSDLVFLEYPKGGAVFAFSSISWCACLSYDNYENNVSRMTKNVLDGFTADTPPWLVEPR